MDIDDIKTGLEGIEMAYKAGRISYATYQANKDDLLAKLRAAFKRIADEPHNRRVASMNKWKKELEKEPATDKRYRNLFTQLQTEALTKNNERNRAMDGMTEQERLNYLANDPSYGQSSELTQRLKNKGRPIQQMEVVEATAPVESKASCCILL